MGFGRGALLWLIGVPLQFSSSWLCSGIIERAAKSARIDQSLRRLVITRKQ